MADVGLPARRIFCSMSSLWPRNLRNAISVWLEAGLIHLYSQKIISVVYRRRGIKIGSSMLINLLPGRNRSSLLTVTEKMKWFYFVERIFAYQFSFQMTPAFNQEDMNALLYRGCLKILKKIKKQI